MCLARGGSELYRACLDIYIVAPTIDFVWADGKNDGMNEKK